MKTLLEKAKDIDSYKSNTTPVTDEEIELAFAWLKGEVTLKQVSLALGENTEAGSARYSMVRFIRAAYQKGMLKLMDKHDER